MRRLRLFAATPKYADSTSPLVGHWYSAAGARAYAAFLLAEHPEIVAVRIDTARLGTGPDVVYTLLRRVTRPDPRP